MTSQRRVVKNAAANLLRGGASAIGAVVLPAVLARHLGSIEYNVWCLVLQVTAYVGYLDFGLQTAIGRYVAFATQKNDSEQRNAIYSTAFAGLCLASVLGICFILTATALAPHVFSSVPQNVLSNLRWTLIIIGTSVALGLPASAWNGVFVGLKRNEIPALTLGGAKLVSVLAVVVIAVRGGSIVSMAVAMAAINVASYAVQYWFVSSKAPEISLRLKLVSRSVIHEIGGYCLSLSVWSSCMLLVTGLDLILVARFEFKSVGAYAIASGIVTFISGLQCAVFGAIMPEAASMSARSDAKSLGQLVLSSTRVGFLLLCLTGIPIIIYSGTVVRMLAGYKYGIDGGQFLSILAFANIIRLVAVPYSSVLIGTGQQKAVILGPICEGLSNLIASVWLGLLFGAKGVALGTLIGALVGIGALFFYNIRATADQVSFTTKQYVITGLVQPGLRVLPLLAILLLLNLGFKVDPRVRLAVWLVSIAASVVLLGKFGSSLQRLTLLGKRPTTT